MKKREINEFEVLEVDMGYSTQCHIPLTWRGKPMRLDQDGYSSMARTREDGKKAYLRVHMVRYAAVHGALEDGLVHDHLCRHRPCCNPAHLEAVTIAENNRRGVGCKITMATVLEARAMHAAGGWTHTSLAKHFGISQSHMTNVLNGAYWSDGLSPAWSRVKERRAKG